MNSHSFSFRAMLCVFALAATVPALADAPASIADGPAPTSSGLSKSISSKPEQATPSTVASTAVQLGLISPQPPAGFAPAMRMAAAGSNAAGVDDESTSTELFEYDFVDSLVIAATRTAESEANARALREQRIKRFFKRKWRGDKTVYRSLEIEFDLLARYYAQHDSAYELIEGLSKQPVYLGYASNTFRTDVKGDALRVRSVKILFDPRSAAVLGRSSPHSSHASGSNAVISSADALLHELLHADIVLNKGKDFISSGAMFSAFYPHEHEAKVIALERELFRDMSRADGIARPLRNTHSGYLLAASCATCLQ